jgi:hypothetical protein
VRVLFHAPYSRHVSALICGHLQVISYNTEYSKHNYYIILNTEYLKDSHYIILNVSYNTEYSKDSYYSILNTEYSKDSHYIILNILYCISPEDNHWSRPKHVASKMHEIKHALIFVANESVLELNWYMRDGMHTSIVKTFLVHMQNCSRAHVLVCELGRLGCECTEVLNADNRVLSPESVTRGTR